jgi:hypothetical protein
MLEDGRYRRKSTRGLRRSAQAMLQSDLAGRT